MGRPDVSAYPKAEAFTSALCLIEGGLMEAFGARSSANLYVVPHRQHVSGRVVSLHTISLSTDIDIYCNSGRLSTSTAVSGDPMSR